ncbi:co-chaperone GrpE [Rhodococcus pyridinivorans KG-16]|uniref:Co-chaperone GrpE n=1 Tax=Rhodococcus pyridinivorans KG-16 TaxID=1441730 RepID=A0A0V9UG91_9NOCA|nr:nucleotide exchange factor GrpE [Rhodococcus pyridinivorans]KSZ57021.1 co-chaperone GrpE [Rhodococcus pyridinivorans KG-16]
MSPQIRERIDELIAAADVAADGPERAAATARLADLGVERLAVEPGTRFDPSRHRAVAVTPAAAPAEENLVAAMIRPGWCHEGQILRYVEVRVQVPPARCPAPGAS